jgi:hypothetical protein
VRGRRVCQESMHDAGQVQLAKDIGHLGVGEHMRRHEPAERLAQALALVGDDGGVWNWYAERVAKQRGYSEPIGDTADESSLGRGLQEAFPPTRRDKIARHGQGGHQDQQAGREQAVLTQGAPGKDIGIRFGHRKSVYARGSLPSNPVQCYTVTMIDPLSPTAGAAARLLLAAMLLAMVWAAVVWAL